MRLLIGRGSLLLLPALILALAVVAMSCQSNEEQDSPPTESPVAPVSLSATGTAQAITIEGVPPGVTPAPTASSVHSHGFFVLSCGWIPGLYSVQQTHFLHWTPDGTQLVFGHDDKIWVAKTDGTEARMLADANQGIEPLLAFGFYADVSPDGSRVVYGHCVREKGGRDLSGQRRGYGYEIRSRTIEGYNLRELTDNNTIENLPAWSPDNTRIAFLASPSTQPTYGNNGLLFNVGLYVMSSSKGLPSGQSVKDSPHVAEDDTFSGALRIWPLNTADRWVEIIAPFSPRWSPDGEQIAFILNNSSTDFEYDGGWEDPLYYKVYDYHMMVAHADGSGSRNLGRTIVLPTWSPDGRQIAYANLDGDGWSIYTISSDGSGLRKVLDNSDLHIPPLPISQLEWSPNGSELLFVADFNIHTVDLDSGNVGRLNYHFWPPSVVAWSPDGSRIALLVSCGARSGVKSSPFDEEPCHRFRLLTLASDGTDRRFVTKPVTDPFLPQLTEAHPITNPEVCSAGEMVPDPESNVGLVEDCKALLASRGALVGGRYLRWDASRPVSHWSLVHVESTIDERSAGDGDSTTDQANQSLRVTGLYLSTCLDGHLPAQIGDLEELRAIRLPGESCGGTPSLSGGLPPEWGELTKLEELDLSDNELTGPVPPEWANLTNLTRLDLTGNFLTGCIGPEFSDMWIEATGLERCLTESSQ